jgi:hypothetical protein
MSDVDFYLANRASYGINTVWVNLLCGPGTGGRSNFTTYDGITPFTSGTDFATPRETYFARVDLILQAAAKYGIIVFLNPAETIDLLSVALSNGATKCRNYGRYLGNRYKNFNNIVWFFGNDFQNWTNYESDEVILSISQGIKDNAPTHLHTTLLDYYVSNSRDDTRWNGIININTAYTYYPTYAEILAGYNLTPAMPVIMGEADYEYERASQPERQRRQEYWTFLAGGCGHLYGNGYIWPFSSGWKSYLSTTGANELQYCKNLFQSRAWYSLVPDQSHVFLTSGYGTFESNGLDHKSISSNDYATAAITANGNLAIIFIPTARTITVDMSKLSGTSSARWYDPTAGTYQTISGSPFANSGSRNFTSSGNHSDGENDWVLVLERV